MLFLPGLVRRILWALCLELKTASLKGECCTLPESSSQLLRFELSSRTHLQVERLVHADDFMET